MKKIIGYHTKLNSFKYGTSYIHLELAHWGSVLGADIYFGETPIEVEKIFLYLGINYVPGDLNKPKSLSLFGGLTKDNYEALKLFLNSKSEKISISYPIPVTFLEDIGKRADNMTSSTYSGFTKEFVNKVIEESKKVKCISAVDLSKNTKSIMVGDSHCYSISPKGVPTQKILAKTLHGAIKEDIFLKYSKLNVNKLYFQFGSVDIQFHIFRQEDPFESLEDLILKYFNKIKEIASKNKQIEICSPIPIVGDNRKLTKTTTYKDKYFYGKREDRVRATIYFIDRMIELCKEEEYITFEHYPISWYYDTPEIHEKRLERRIGHHINLNYSRMNNYGITEEDNFEEW